jgi:phosphoglycolate phosphatase-like HAD superfamily hydrolase
LKGRSWKEELETTKADYIISELSELENLLLSNKVDHINNKGL